MSSKDQKNATLVGFFLFLGLICLGVLVAQFGNIGGSFRGDYPLHISFDDASGLVKDSQVTYGGAKVGRVTTKPFMNSKGIIEISIEINGNVKIPKNSTFNINSVSFLGDKSIAIRPPKTLTGEFIAPNSHIDGMAAAGIDSITDDAQDIVKSANEAIKDIRNMAKRFDSSISKLDKLMIETTAVMNNMNVNVLNKKNSRSITNIIANIEKSSADIKESTEKIKPLIAKAGPIIDDAKIALKDIKATSKTVDAAFAKAIKEMDRLEPALANLPETMKEFKQAATKSKTMMIKVGNLSDAAKKFIYKLENNNGLLSALTKDKQLKKDTKIFVKNLKTYGVLRYRDEETEEKPTPRKNRFKGSRR